MVVISPGGVGSTLLIDQLAPGGILVMPIGTSSRDQHVWRIRKGEDGSTTAEKLWPVRFVPLIKGKAEAKPAAARGDGAA